MVLMRNLVPMVSAFLGLVSAAPTFETRSFTPGTANNTQDFYLKLSVTEGATTYDGWYLEAYHTGAGFADPCFTSGTGSATYLNNTQLQFDVGYILAANANIGDTNYARWENVPLESGYGTSGFYINGTAGLVTNTAEFGGWLVCEWWHGVNVPQLFQLITGFNPPNTAYPATCSKVTLQPEFF